MLCNSATKSIVHEQCLNASDYAQDAARGDMYAGQDVGADTLATVEAVLDRSLAPKWRSGAQLMQELRHIVQVLPTGCTA